jgi:hypothetical protein
MSQILHILRKDTRHHWPEILLSLALLISFTVEQPRIWIHQTFDSRFLSGLISFLPAFMVISWAFLIIRLIQGESLVGDRLFWVTRPYEWHKLLAAKLLSVALFIHLPLLVCQLILLKLASFPALSSIPGLLFIHFLLILSLVLPCLTIASITSGIGQAAVAILILFLCLLGLLLFFTLNADMDFATDATDSIQAFIYLAAASTAILFQYIYRRTRLARIVVGTGAALIFLVIVLAPYKTLINRDFPLPTPVHSLPAQFTLDRSLTFAHDSVKGTNFYGDEVGLEIPLQISSLAETTIAQIRGVRLDIEMPTGEQWSTHWHSHYDTVTYGRTLEWPNISMKKAVFNRVKNVPVRAHLTLALNVYQTGAATQIIVAGDRLNIASGARCLNDLSQNALHCFSALKQPQPLLVMAQLPNSSCQVSQEVLAEGLAEMPAFYSVLSSDDTPDLALSPIKQFDIDLSRQFVFEDRQLRLPICSGTSLLVSKPKFLYSVRDEIDLGDITLLNYLPTYPRRIVPPHQPLEPGTPSNSLSLSVPPRSSRTGPS